MLAISIVEKVCNLQDTCYLFFFKKKEFKVLLFVMMHYLYSMIHAFQLLSILFRNSLNQPEDIEVLHGDFLNLDPKDPAYSEVSLIFCIFTWMNYVPWLLWESIVLLTSFSPFVWMGYLIEHKLSYLPLDPVVFSFGTLSNHSLVVSITYQHRSLFSFPHKILILWFNESH